MSKRERKQQRLRFEGELRAERTDDSEVLPKISGYAAVFDETVDLGPFTESIAPGAFEESLERKDDVRALFNHDANFPLGRLQAGTLELEEDDRGLHMEIEPPDTTYARDLVESIRRGDVSQASFGFFIDSEEIVRKEGEKTHFRITKASLFDVSPVTFPAYDGTEVEVERHLRDRKEQLNRLEEDEKRLSKAEKELRDREIELLKTY